MSPITRPGESRERVFRFVQRRLHEGRPPTIREVQKALGFRSVQTARQHLEQLAAEGRLVHHPGRARGYELPPGRGGQRARLVPVLGRIQAGSLTAAIEEPDGHVAVRARWGEELFGLRVSGESMTGVGILPGDIVIVRAQPTAASGEIVVALVEDEATVKRFRLQQGRIELHPENPAFPPLILPPNGVRILGKVIEVRRCIEGEER